MVRKLHPPFERARSPAHRQVRATALLDAAAALCLERSPQTPTLAEAAARAGLSKAAVYGYFSTKEELLLAVLARELSGFFDALGAGLPSVRRGDAAGAARVVLRAVDARPVLTRLLPRLSGELEHNLTLEVALAFKQATLAQVAAAGAALERALPWLRPGDGGRVLLRLAAAVAGLWPMAHPLGAVREVLARPELAPLRVDFSQELSHVVRALLARPPPSPRRPDRSRS